MLFDAEPQYRDMWLVSARDLQWRRRRFLIAVISASLVFSLTLILDGMTTHISNEVARVVDGFRADGWVVAPGKSGPFTATRFLQANVVDEVAHLPGVDRADAMIAARDTVNDKWTNVLGYTVGGLGEPSSVKTGRLPAGPGEALVDEMLGFKVGDTVSVGGVDFTVVGVSSDLSFNFGAPTVMLPIAEVQRVLLGGQSLVGAVAIAGQPDVMPSGLQLMTNAQVKADMHLGMDQSLQTVVILNGLLWIIAAAIIASMVYLSSLERGREFAVMKALGVSNRSMMAGLASSSLLLAVLAGIGATMLALLLGPRFPMPVETPATSYLRLLGVSVIGRTPAHVGRPLPYGGPSSPARSRRRSASRASRVRREVRGYPSV